MTDFTIGMRWDIATQKRFEDSLFLEAYGFRVYSQNDEDGIISEIFDRIGATNKRFIEFGVQNGLESNSHYLLHKGWNGLWIEGDSDFCKEINDKFRPVIKTGRLTVVNEFITKDNINQLFVNGGVQGEIDLLSVDIDGNDYHVWKAINAVSPRVVIIEYNAKFPPECEWCMAYNEFHMWDGSDRHGASLKSLELLGNEKGYHLVGTNISGTNAFFVREDLANDLFPMLATAENLYNPIRDMPPHHNGHPSSVCLCDQLDGMAGIFECMDSECNFVSGVGFYDAEFDKQGKFQVQWMSRKQARIFVRTGIDKPRYLDFSFINHIGSMNVKIIVDDGATQIFNCLSVPDAETTVVIEKDYVAEDILSVDIEANQLWAPSILHGTNDTRRLALGITKLKVR